MCGGRYVPQVVPSYEIQHFRLHLPPAQSKEKGGASTNVGTVFNYMMSIITFALTLAV